MKTIINHQQSNETTVVTLCHTFLYIPDSCHCLQLFFRCMFSLFLSHTLISFCCLHISVSPLHFSISLTSLPPLCLNLGPVPHPLQGPLLAGGPLGAAAASRWCRRPARHAFQGLGDCRPDFLAPLPLFAWLLCTSSPAMD